MKEGNGAYTPLSLALALSSLEFISYLSSNNVLAISSFIFLFLRLVYFLSHASSTHGLHPLQLPHSTLFHHLEVVVSLGNLTG